jgi:osmotically-inducible protein OsmY
VLPFVARAPYCSAEEIRDADVREAVEHALMQDQSLAAPDISVAVRHGVVHLTGHVTNLAAKKFAVREAAKIRGALGVVQVNNLLKVDPNFRTDELLEEELAVELGADALLHHQEIRVNVVKGVASLSGIVNNDREYQQAVTVAKRIAGVREVVNRLDIEPRDAVGDADARATIEALLRWNFLTATIAPLIDVSVDNAVVSLHGQVAYQWQKQVAEQVARGAKGIRKVENRLSVAPGR